MWSSRLFGKSADAPQLRMRDQPAPERSTGEEARSAPTNPSVGDSLADGVLSGKGGLFEIADTNLMNKCALVRENGVLKFYALTSAISDTPAVGNLKRRAELEFTTSIQGPIPCDAATIRTIYARLAEAAFGKEKASEIRAKLFASFEMMASRRTNDMILDWSEAETIIKSQKDNYLSDPVKRLAMTSTDGEMYITSCFALADSGDAVEQPAADQKFTIVKPHKLPDGVQCIRGQIAPTETGRRLTLRFIYKSSHINAKSLEHVGLLDKSLDKLYIVQNRGAGLFTNTAPTDSGKSTTLNLFSIDMVRAKEGRLNVIGIDDPVEFLAPEICSLAVRDRGDGVDPFKEKVYVSLRMAPQAMKVGECRTFATGMAAIEAAYAGLLVMTTHHSDGALEVPTRYELMGVPRHIAFDPQLHVCWMSQRLLPALCPHCRIKITELPADFPRRRRATINQYREILVQHPGDYYVRGAGCKECVNEDEPTMPGIKGRKPVFEVVLPDAQLCRLVAEGLDREARDYMIVDLDSPTMILHGFMHLRAGLVGIEEFAKIATPYNLRSDLAADKLASSPREVEAAE